MSLFYYERLAAEKEQPNNFNIFIFRRRTMNLVTSMKDVLKKIKYPGKPLPDGLVGITSALGVKVIRADGSEQDFGIVGRRCVTNAFVTYLCASFVNSTTSALDIFKYHEPGTGTAAESTANTALGTAVGVRGTGVNTSATNVFTSISTITFTAAAAITEHGVFSSSASGTLLDRTSFAAVNVASNDSIGFTYQLTCTAGG
jgi:hypothetical protein